MGSDAIRQGFWLNQINASAIRAWTGDQSSRSVATVKGSAIQGAYATESTPQRPCVGDTAATKCSPAKTRTAQVRRVTASAVAAVAEEDAGFLVHIVE